MNQSLLSKSRYVASVAVVSMVVFIPNVHSNPKIREAFFTEYPGAVTTRLHDLPSNAGHCGVCHLNFDGGGPRNPYGLKVQENVGAGKDKQYDIAVQMAANVDSDGDGVINIVEITDNGLTYDNTPTFPGLTAGNVGGVSFVTVSEITGYLAPSSGEDTTDPSVTLNTPNGGETAVGNSSITVTWTASDASGIAGIDLYASLDGGTNYTPIALGLPNSPSSFTWFVPNRPSNHCLIKVVAIDNASRTNEDDSDGVFDVVSPAGGLAPTTLRDFDQPGSQPLVDSGLPQADPNSCKQCHGGYSEEHEPHGNWLGSMMAHAAYDPIFKANMVIANQDAPDSGDLCLRCHNSRGWLDGRSTPTDGSQMTMMDNHGVSCDLCHRLVDPVYQPGRSPAADETILNSLEAVPSHPGNGMYVFDPNSHRRGPFDDSVSPHTDLHSPFHQEAALCGTCHDVSNPVFVRDGTNTEYLANSFDEASPTNSPFELMPVERTYSEWLHSEYNTTNGVYAPQFAGNKSGGMVATCQDCHMPDIQGHGADPAQYSGVPLRQNLPLHDMTGGSTWLTKIMPTIEGFPYGPGTPEATAITNGAMRADYMLRKAARMHAEQDGDSLKVMVVNDTGHKLPTGYPEGRRMWINLRFYDEADNLLAEHGGYDYSTGLLTNSNTRVYEVHPGIGSNLASTLNSLNPGLNIDPGPSFHFVLNNQVFEDNRIPPRGFTNSEFESFGGAPVGHHYDDGQYWDHAFFDMPEGAVRAHARLFYQSTSKEFMEFLRDENTTDNAGTNVYNMWVANDRCPPVLMTEAFWPENFYVQSIGPVDGASMGISFSSVSGYTYWVEYADVLGSNIVWKPFVSNGMIEAWTSSTIFTDDFSTATSGETSTNGHRFYRIRR